MARRALIAYYSMTGNTRKIADEIRDAMDPDVQVELEEIREPRPRRGVPGVARALVDALLRREPPLAPVSHNPRDYDLLVLGGPIWAGRMASPVRSYARLYGSRAPQVAFFCTEGGNGADRAFAEIEDICHRPPRATLVVDARHLEPAAHRSALSRFTTTAQTSVA